MIKLKTAPPDGAEYAYWHRGAGGCFGIAFYMTHKPAPGSVLLAEDVTKLDGTVPNFADMVLCGTCGKVVTMPKAEDVQKLTMLGEF